MKYHQLGKSDLKISEIAFGCMSLGENQSQNHRLLRMAVEAGINFFDTADLYQRGLNEEYLGKAMQDIRKDVIIATKVGNQWRPDGSGWDWNPTKGYILKAVDESLKRLRSDYIDLYQLHGGTIEDPIDEAIEAFELLKDQGKIRCYGISSIRPNVIREYVSRSGIVSVMLQYSLLDRRPEESILELLEQQNVGVLARGPLAKGLLAGKPPASYLSHSRDEVANAIAALKAAAAPGQPIGAPALQYVNSAAGVTAAVVGIRTTDQLQEALAAANSDPMSKAMRQQLSAKVRKFKYNLHR